MAYTDLQMAASFGDLNLVQDLIARGVAVNAIGIVGKWTPLHVAAGRGHVGVVHALLRAHASVHATDQDGRTAREWAERSGFDAISSELHGLEGSLGARSWETVEGRDRIILMERRQRDLELKRIGHEATYDRDTISTASALQLQRELAESRQSAAEFEQQLVVLARGEQSQQLEAEFEAHAMAEQEMKQHAEVERFQQLLQEQHHYIESLTSTRSATKMDVADQLHVKHPMREHTDVDKEAHILEALGLRQQLEASNAELASCRDKNDQARAEVATMEQTTTHLRGELARERSAADELKAECDELKVELIEAQDSARKAETRAAAASRAFGR